MNARFTFGDIIENGWASDENPSKRGVYLWSFTRTGRMNPGKHVKLLHEDGRTGELLIADDDKMIVVGTIFDAKVEAALSAKDAEIAQLREELASTYEELIDHTGDGMDDARAKRVAELRALQPTSGGEA